MSDEPWGTPGECAHVLTVSQLESHDRGVRVQAIRQVRERLFCLMGMDARAITRKRLFSALDALESEVQS